MQLAVTMMEPAGLLVYSSENEWGNQPLRLDTTPGAFEVRETTCAAFNHDGNLLCVGYWCENGYADRFGLWDLKSASCIRYFHHPESQGLACVFSPANDLLALGGGKTRCVLHELLPVSPQPPFAMPGGNARTLCAACTGDEVVVLASGSRLTAMRRDEEGHQNQLWQKEMEEEVFAENYP
eukprot:COSAG06_NODE_30182_length_543_cov_0.930180_1_plen_180_part_11